MLDRSVVTSFKNTRSDFLTMNERTDELCALEILSCCQLDPEVSNYLWDNWIDIIAGRADTPGTSSSIRGGADMLRCGRGMMNMALSTDSDSFDRK